jgi:hypothetical protein
MLDKGPTTDPYSQPFYSRITRKKGDFCCSLFDGLTYFLTLHNMETEVFVFLLATIYEQNTK